MLAAKAEERKNRAQPSPDNGEKGRFRRRKTIFLMEIAQSDKIQGIDERLMENADHRISQTIMDDRFGNRSQIDARFLNSPRKIDVLKGRQFLIEAAALIEKIAGDSDVRSAGPWKVSECLDGGRRFDLHFRRTCCNGPR